MPSVKIKQPDPPAEEVPLEVLSTSINHIATAADILLRSKIKRQTLLLLIQHGCPSSDRPTLKQIEAVLTSARDLAKNHLRM